MGLNRPQEPSLGACSCGRLHGSLRDSHLLLTGSGQAYSRIQIRQVVVTQTGHEQYLEVGDLEDKTEAFLHLCVRFNLTPGH